MLFFFAQDHKLGAFRSDSREDVKRIMHINNEIINTFPELAFGMPTWLVFPPR